MSGSDPTCHGSNVDPWLVNLPVQTSATASINWGDPEHGGTVWACENHAEAVMDWLVFDTGARVDYGEEHSADMPCDRRPYMTPEGIKKVRASGSEAHAQERTIRRPDQGPWRTVDDVELATLGWVHWHNTDRLHSYLDDVPPQSVPTDQ